MIGDKGKDTDWVRKGFQRTAREKSESEYIREREGLGKMEFAGIGDNVE